VGALTCSACARKVVGTVLHGAAYYRCRYPREYALANRVHHPRPADKAALYRGLGLALTYDVSKHKVLVEMHLDQNLVQQARGLSVRGLSTQLAELCL
jgi:hypothetical protein